MTWAIPAAIGAWLKDNLENRESTAPRELCKGQGITSVTVDGEECMYSPARKYSAYLKQLYAQWKGKNLAPFKLARIEKEEVENRKDCDDFTKATLRGDLDDLVYTKYSIEEDKIGIPSHTGLNTNSHD